MDPLLAARGGWRPEGDALVGTFVLPWQVATRVPLGLWGTLGVWLRRRPVRVVGRLAPRGRTIAVYVKDPPRGGGYEHTKCLQLVEGGWFSLHFEVPARSAEAAVVFTEAFLQACAEGRDT